MASSSLMPRQSIILVYCTKNKSSGSHTRRYQAEFPGRKSKDECVRAARLRTHGKLLCKLPGGSILVGYSGLKVPFTRKKSYNYYNPCLLAEVKCTSGPAQRCVTMSKRVDGQRTPCVQTHIRISLLQTGIFGFLFINTKHFP